MTIGKIYNIRQVSITLHYGTLRMPETKELLFWVLFDAVRRFHDENNRTELPKHPDHLETDQRKAFMRICEMLLESGVINTGDALNVACKKAQSNANTKDVK